MENRNYYDILGVTYKATLDEITSAKNKLAKKYHPDVNMRKGIDTTEQMQEILEAYAILSDKKKRAEYDRELRGTTSIMQTFDLSKSEEDSEPITDSGFVAYWKASSALFDIVNESSAYYRHRNKEIFLSSLATKALKYILVLREAQIPERYWHPDIMNWLLFQSYKNRNYTTSYLLSLYDKHLKSMALKEKLKSQKLASTYQQAVKKLLKY